VADIATCFACEFFTPNTTGTFAVPRSRAPVRGRVAAGKVPSLQVTASVDTAGHVTILDVNPVDAAPKSATSSSFGLTATGGGHQVTVPMIASFSSYGLHAARAIAHAQRGCPGRAGLQH
jgi:hypothetical protein